VLLSAAEQARQVDPLAHNVKQFTSEIVVVRQLLATHSELEVRQQAWHPDLSSRFRLGAVLKKA
jgi:hypothetical protein